MGNRTKEDELYREMCRVVGKVVLEMRDLGQEKAYCYRRRITYSISQ